MQQTIKDKEEEKLKTNNPKTNSGYLRVMRLRQHFLLHYTFFFLRMICMVWFSLNMGTKEHVLEGGHFLFDTDFIQNSLQRDFPCGLGSGNYLIIFIFK